ncbi:hypothetical protein D3C86_1867890 [compost metagenome]
MSVTLRRRLKANSPMNEAPSQNGVAASTLIADRFRCMVRPFGKAASSPPSAPMPPRITALPVATSGMSSRNDSSPATLVSPTRVLKLKPMVRMSSAYTIS